MGGGGFCPEQVYLLAFAGIKKVSETSGVSRISHLSPLSFDLEVVVVAESEKYLSDVKKKKKKNLCGERLERYAYYLYKS